MKKIVFLAFALLLTIATLAGPVTPQRAQAVASTVLRTTATELQEVAREAGFEHLYCYNYASEGRQGFVVVSGDDLLSPVIAFSEEGVMNPATINPSVRWWLSQYDVVYDAAKGITPDAAVSQQWKDLENGIWASRSKREGVPSLLDGIKWGQGAPYNMFCPGNSVTGCVATAFGQIMRYWKFPEHGWGSHSYTGEGKPIHYPNWTYGTLSVDYQNTYYDWEHMPKELYLNSSDTEKVAVAQLLYHIGVSLDMNYSPNGSGCWSLYEYSIAQGAGELDSMIGADKRIPRYFGYRYSYAGMRDSIGNDSIWTEMLYQSLAEGKPIYYAGWAVDTTSPTGYSPTDGHGFVMDGYRETAGIEYFRFNWGWNGSCDGWFMINKLTPRTGVGPNAYTYDFTRGHGAVIGLEPDSNYNGEHPYGVDPVLTQQGKVFGFDGRIFVRGAENAMISVFDVMGRCVAHREKMSQGEWQCDVPRGVYVVRIGNARGMKVATF